MVDGGSTWGDVYERCGRCSDELELAGSMSTSLTYLECQILVLDLLEDEGDDGKKARTTLIALFVERLEEVEEEEMVRLRCLGTTLAVVGSCLVCVTWCNISSRRPSCRLTFLAIFFIGDALGGELMPSSVVFGFGLTNLLVIVGGT